MSGETETSVSGWTVDTLRYALNQQLEDLRIMLDERYATQVKAVDAAFIAQSTAMQTAFTAADRAVQAALESAEKAVTKAETAAEKRFEAVNEFRGQLADQAATFLPRTEADVRITALAEKLDAGVSRNAQGIIELDQRSIARYSDLGVRLGEMDSRHLSLLNEIDRRVSSRLDVLAGRSSGSGDTEQKFRLNTSVVLAVLTMIVTAVGVTIAIIVATH